jgi:ribosomal protein L2
VVDFYTGEGVDALVKKKLAQTIVVSEIDYDDDENTIVDPVRFEEGEEVYVLARGIYVNGGYMFVVYSPKSNEATTIHEMHLVEVPANA